MALPSLLPDDAELNSENTKNVNTQLLPAQHMLQHKLHARVKNKQTNGFAGARQVKQESNRFHPKTRSTSESLE